MYGQLTWDAKRGLLSAPLVEINLGLELTDPELKVRIARAATLVKQKIKGATAQESQAQQLVVLTDMSSVARQVPEAQFAFAMHMCLAHHLLPAERFKIRTDKIQKIFDAQFAEFKAKPKELTDLIVRFKGLATLVPDSFLEHRVNMFCVSIRTSLIESSKLREYDDRRALTKKIKDRANEIKGKGKTADLLGTMLNIALDEYPPAEFGSLGFSLQGSLNELELFLNMARFVEAASILSQDASDLPHEYIRTVGPQMLKEALTRKVRSTDDWVEFGQRLMSELKTAYDLASNLALWATVRAVESGIDMGEETPKFQAAVQQLRQVSAAVDRRMSERLPKPQPGGSSSKAPSLNAEDPVLSWSIDKLAQWIEGPVVEPAKTVIDRAKIVARVHDAQKHGLALQAPTVVPHVTPGKPSPGKPTPYKPTPAKPTPAKPLPTELTLDNVDAVVRTGFQGCVQYFLAEIADMAPSAKALGGAVDVMKTLDHVATELKGLQFDPSHFSELTARNLLNKAETQIQILRGSLHKAQASAKLMAIFPKELSVALGNEPLVLGKRNGRQIGCPVLLEDWHFVNSTFHDRWLSEVVCIEVDGTPMQLRPDQALALYVTGSSLSGYAFDVSVHLWRRRPGTDNPPSREQSPYPQMDKAFWFDTYTTCCVLHVPLRH